MDRGEDVGLQLVPLCPVWLVGLMIFMTLMYDLHADHALCTNWGAEDAWLSAPCHMTSFGCPSPPLVIRLPYDHLHSSCSQ